MGVKCGIIGDGYWGKIIKSKLEILNVNISFCVNSENDYRDLIESVDFVFVCTPTYTHYEIVSFCLENGKHVFCEKPCTGDVDKTIKLFKLAEKNNVGLYVDDLFVNRCELKDIPTPKYSIIIETNKYGSFSDTIFNSLVYHDLTILNHFIGLDISTLNLLTNDRNKKHISFTINKVEIVLIYNRICETKSKTIIVDGVEYDLSKPMNDSLLEIVGVFISNPFVSKDNKKQTIKIDEILQKMNFLEKQIAVIGGGIFGCTVAIKLSQIGYNVTLFEQDNDILQRASSINQYRLHKGYHYPRSLDTAIESRNAERGFIKMYGDAISNDHDHYYCIANENSFVTPEEYINFLEESELDYTIIDNHPVNNVGLTVSVREYLINPNKLRELCWDKLKQSGVVVKLNREVNITSISEGYDKIIVAAYASMNSALGRGMSNEIYQFELCEKPILRLSKKYVNKSIVIMDGPFMCIDPLVGTDYHLMGNVKYAIHHTNNGKTPTIPSEFNEILNKGIIKNPPISNIDKFIDSASNFFNDVGDYEHIGSMFTVRTVLPNREHDDSRPSVVTQVTKDIITIFSGKIGTCVKVANDVIELVNV